MKLFYTTLLLLLLHGILYTQCENFTLTISDLQPPTCPNSADGAITLNVTGAQGTVSYTWAGVSSSGSSAIDLGPGTYSVTATDDEGCAAEENVVLEAAIVADAGPDVEAYCGIDTVTIGGIANTEIYFSGDIMPIEFSDSNQELVPVRSISGEVGFYPAPTNFTPSPDSLYLEVGSATASRGDVVCLPVRVYNFTDIVGAAFTINFDPAYLSFTQVMSLNPGLPGFSEAANMGTPNTGLDNGFIILNYFNLDLSGVSLQDGSTLFTLCFEVLNINASSTGPDITYQWAGPNSFTSTELFPEVTESGNYTLRVTNTSQVDCWAEDVVEVLFEPDSIGITLSDTLTACTDQPITLSPIISGGTGPYTFQWSNGATTQDINVISSPTPQTYALTVTSAEGCTGLAGATVAAQNNTAPVVSLGPDRDFCPGEPFSISATATGGPGPFTFLWNDGMVTLGANRILTLNAPSTYWVDVVDANGCQSATSDSIVLTPSPPSAVDLGPDLIICPGEQVTFSPGVSGPSAVDYLWNTGFVGPVHTVQPAQTTTYSVTVVNIFGCTATDAVDVIVNNALLISDLVSFCDDNGTPSDPSDDTFSFQTTIDGNPGGGWVSNLGLTGFYGQPATFGPFPVSGGNVTLTVADSNNPSCSETIIVSPSCEPAVCEIVPTFIADSCDFNGTPSDPTDDTFTVLIKVDGNQTGPFWLASDGSTGTYGDTAIFGPFLFDAGPVTITFADADDPTCVETFTHQPPNCDPPDCNLQAAVQEVLCNDNGTPADTTDDTFNLEILVSGGPGSGWVEDSSGLSGDYGVPFTFGPYPADYGHVGLIFRDFDDAFCIKTFDLYTPVACAIDCQQNPIILTTTILDISCNGSADGVAEVIAAGGGGGYQYNWDIGISGSVVANLPAGTYTVTVTDIFGCEAIQSVTLSEPPLLMLALTAIPILCSGGDDGEINVFVTGGTPPYTSFWIGPNGFTSTESNLVGLSEEGTYTITVTDANGCSTIQSVDVSANSPIDLSIEIIQQPSCDDSSDGILQASASGGSGTYEYLWSTGFIGPIHPDLNPGVYSVTVVDENGCTATVSIVLEALLNADAGPNQVLSCNIAQVVLDGSASTMGPNIVYQWIGPNGFFSDQLSPTVSLPGTYTLELTDLSQPSCTAQDEVEVLLDTVTADATIFVNYASCDSVTLSHSDFANQTWVWILPNDETSTELSIGVTESGLYTLVATDLSNGCSATDSVQIDLDPSICATLKGRLVRDTVLNCIAGADEPGLSNWLMVIQGGGRVYYAVTQADGYYEQRLPVGDYLVYPLVPNLLWMPCQNNYLANLQVPGEMVVLDIPVIEAEPCPELTVDFSLPILRRCWTRSLHINYCNEGTAVAEDATVVITLDDFFTFQSATAPLLSQDGNQYTFAIGDVAINQCGSFIVQVEVSCDAIVGQSLCAEAKIFPNGPCFPPSPNWSGASLQISGVCEDGEVQFRVENVGAVDMAAPRPCIVIEDGVMLLTAPENLLLNSGESFTYSFPANGSTYRIEVEQEPFHPGFSLPTVVLEGCGVNAQGGFSTGFVNQLPLDDADPFIDIECREVVGSYDPNDKHGFPRGYGEAHFIYPGTDIEYLVQFQNTGNDTAFLVVIRDTLSPFLDITSVQPGAASHPYTWDIDSSNILVFTFEDILLPDSTTNLAGSQGFVEFKVAQQENLPLGTVIENSAAIYFDVNEPIITNTIFHTLGYDFIEVVNFTPEVGKPRLKIKALPNPMGKWAVLQLEGWPEGEGLFELFDLQGQRLREQRFSGATFRFERQGLPAGIYAFRIVDGQGRWGSGRLVVR